MRAELLQTIPVGNVLGEGVLWDDLTQTVWWTDIQSCRLYRYMLQSGDLREFTLPERLGCFGFVTGERRLICAFASGIALYDPDSAELDWLYRPELQFQGTRFNDGRVDRQGRFWAGTMVEAAPARDDQGQPVSGSLYSIRGREQRRVLTDIGISNSLCWSLDGATMYFADSTAGRIRAYAFDQATGLPGDSTEFAVSSAAGVPDGSVIDAAGYLWNAEWGGSRIVRYAPSGNMDFELALPVSQPTCMCFGGAAMNLLFVTTARENLSPEQLQTQTEAGNVLIYQTDYRGVPECRYRGGPEDA